MSAIAVLTLTLVAGLYVQRQITQSKLVRINRELSNEYEYKRTFTNLVALEFRKYLLQGGNSINSLIVSCNRDTSTFQSWYSDSYQDVPFTVSACDNTDGDSSFTNDSDQLLWFKVDATYTTGSKKTYYMLLDAGVEPCSPPLTYKSTYPTDSGPESVLGNVDLKEIYAIVRYKIQVFDIESGALKREIPIPNYYKSQEGTAFCSADKSKICIPEYNTNYMFIVDLNTETSQRINMNVATRNLAYNDPYIISGYDGISIYNMNTGQVNTMSLGNPCRPVARDITSSDPYFYTVCGSSGKVYKIDPTTMTNLGMVAQTGYKGDAAAAGNGYLHVMSADGDKYSMVNLSTGTIATLPMPCAGADNSDCIEITSSLSTDGTVLKVFGLNNVYVYNVTTSPPVLIDTIASPVDVVDPEGQHLMADGTYLVPADGDDEIVVFAGPAGGVGEGGASNCY